MSHNLLELREGALLVADAHYSSKNPQLLAFIEALNDKKILTSQLILLGDSFDALFGEVLKTYDANREIIDALHQLSENIEVIFFEGNHDFQLQKIFPNNRVYTLEMQPVMAYYGEKKVLLSHGDFDGGWSYLLYSKIIRNPVVARGLSVLNNIGDDFILKALAKKLLKKNNCIEMENFGAFVQKRFLHSAYECDYFIDGHFHQNKKFTLKKFEYINLDAFACNQRYFSVKFLQDKELLEEFSF